ncbi:MAG: L,D-transpeptidase [Actinomycetota bacterium]
MAALLLLGLFALSGLPPPVDQLERSAARAAPAASPIDAPQDKALIGRVVVDEVVARVAPESDADVIESFGPLNPEGAPQVFLIEDAVDAGAPEAEPVWYEALLPVRPNGTTGFLPASALDIKPTPYRIEIDRAAFELTLFEDGVEIERYDVGIGKGKTPTPVGRFYLTSLLRPPDPGSVYGTYAYGLSGYSDTLLDWEGGGVIGLHGTNNPDSVGRPISHGCIRMRNRDIEELVPILPLGTPIEIV